MNSRAIKKMIFSKRKKQSLRHNLFMYGVSGIITNEQDFIDYMVSSGIDVVDISNFEIHGSNVWLKVKGGVNIKNNLGSTIRQNLTQFIDVEDKVRIIGQQSFYQTKFWCINTGVELINVQSFRDSKIEVGSFRMLTFLNQNRHFRNTRTLRRLYFPKKITNSVHASDAYWTFLECNSNWVMYVNKNYDDDANWGSTVDRCVIDLGVDVRVIDNYLPPNEITDLSVSDISDTSIKINFTPPASTNDIDYYEVWIEKDLGDEDFEPGNRYLPQKTELLGSGEIYSGLQPDTDYILRITAVDEFFNGSGLSLNPVFSNEVKFRTLP